MTSTRVRAGLIATTALSTLMMAGCSSSDTETEASTSATASPEASETAVALETLTEGKLTIATGEPAYEPWVVGDAPESGEGFEAAVAYAVAEELGFAAEDVVWVRSSFDSAIAPGAKDWDLNIQQFSITEERKNAVDFSSPYYTTTQAVVTVEGSAAADAASVADLADLKVGVPSGTTSYTVAAEVLGDQNLAVFNSSEDTVLALNSGQIDAFVIDLPSAFYLAAVELDGGKILGQFEDATGGDEFGFVLPKGSALTEAVTGAVDALTEDGTLAAIETEWLSDAVDVPVLK
ncbi:ABC transporter substrate-binding protein [Demequina mangrovi]|uniref:Amino acid ABC transporter substrate-binding protein, PAAT family n=1 Tax=Demequina mangrovi TaxID=1043493 RepID=A0A1H6YB06_9MICO|nr:ABC transporter substrate-binding protein [Demequina mangrovi]SEJ36207.1 amino acid ABC transporter substrate-binding protein, PAAT family [Demequina mangrovi]